MKHIYTVGQVNSYIKNMFTQDFLLQSILVKGEVSNCKYHSSGHLYFTLKDERGAIACVMFAGNRGGLKFHMQEGQQVVVTGTVENDGGTTGVEVEVLDKTKLDGLPAVAEDTNFLLGGRSFSLYEVTENGSRVDPKQYLPGWIQAW